MDYAIMGWCVCRTQCVKVGGKEDLASKHFITASASLYFPPSAFQCTFTTQQKKS